MKQPTFAVTEQIKKITIEITTSSDRCDVCVKYRSRDGFPPGYDVCNSGDWSESVTSTSNRVGVETLVITARKNYFYDDVDSVSCHITVRLIVEYTGDWLEPPETGGRAPVSIGSALMIALVILLIGAIRRR